MVDNFGKPILKKYIMQVGNENNAIYQKNTDKLWWNMKLTNHFIQNGSPQNPFSNMAIDFTETLLLF